MVFFMRYTVGRQLTAAFAIPLAFIVAITAAAFWGFAQLNRAQTQITHARDIASLAQNIPYTTLLVRAMSKEYGFAPNPDNAKAVSQALADVHASIDALDDADDVTSRTHLAAMKDYLTRYDSDVETVLSADPKVVLAAYNGAKNAMYFTKNERIAIGIRIDKEAAATIAQTKASVIDANLRLGATQRTVEITLIACGIASLLAALVAGLRISQRLSKRLQNVSNSLEVVISKDFSSLAFAIASFQFGRPAQVEIQSPLVRSSGSDEVTDIIKSYNALVGGLEGIADSWNSRTIPT
jgi:hypothetical protein